VAAIQFNLVVSVIGWPQGATTPSSVISQQDVEIKVYVYKPWNFTVSKHGYTNAN